MTGEVISVEKESAEANEGNWRRKKRTRIDFIWFQWQRPAVNNRRPLFVDAATSKRKSYRDKFNQNQIIP